MNMKFISIIIILRILQFSTLLPIEFDEKTRKFRKSACLKLYTIVVLVAIQVYCVLFIQKLMNIFIGNPFINTHDVILIFSTNVTNLFPILFMIYFNTFRNQNLIQIGNDILECYNMIQWQETEFLSSKGLIIWIISEFTVFPIIFSILNYYLHPHSTIEISVLVILLFGLCVMSFMTMIPFYLTLLFVSIIFERINGAFYVLLKSQNTNDLNHAIDNFLKIYLKIMNIKSKITERYKLIILSFLLMVLCNFTWATYEFCARISYFIAIGIQFDQTIIALLSVAKNLFYSFRNLILLTIIVQKVFNRYGQMMINVNDLRCQTNMNNRDFLKKVCVFN